MDDSRSLFIEIPMHFGLWNEIEHSDIYFLLMFSIEHMFIYI